MSMAGYDLGRGNRDRDRPRDRDRDREGDGRRDKDDYHNLSKYSRDGREYYDGPSDRDRDRREERDQGRGRDRDYDRRGGGSGKRDYGRYRSRSRSRSRDRGRSSRRHYDRDGGRPSYNSGQSSGYGGNRGGRDKSPIVLFDRCCVEALSPFRGAVLALQHRQRILRNWDAAPPGFERISADKAKKTGLFPPPGNIAKITNFVPPTLDPTKAAMLSMLTGTTIDSSATTFLPTGAALFAPALAKQARRVYVGNIPKACTEEEIGAYFEENMTAMVPPPHGDYVIGVEISGDKDYAFIDFRTSDEAGLAVRLDQAPFKGQTINVRRTREYEAATSITSSSNAQGISPMDEAAVAPEENQLVISDLPPFITEAHLKFLLTPFGYLKFIRLLRDESSPEITSYGVAVLEVDDAQLVEAMQKHLDGFTMGSYTLNVKKLPDCVVNELVASVLSLFSLTPGKATADPSLIVQLLNVVSMDDLESDEEYELIKEDIRQECENYGRVINLVIPRPRGAHQVAGLGKVFVEYNSIDEAMRAVNGISGRTFSDRTVLTSYYPVEKYSKKIF